MGSIIQDSLESAVSQLERQARFKAEGWRKDMLRQPRFPATVDSPKGLQYPFHVSWGVAYTRWCNYGTSPGMFALMLVFP